MLSEIDAAECSFLGSGMPKRQWRLLDALE